MYKITLSIIFLLAITQTAFAQMTDTLVNGKSIQAVKAGSMIEPVTYKITDLNRISDAFVTYPTGKTGETLGLKMDCGTLPSVNAECTIFGRIPANTSGDEYEVSFIASGNHVAETREITIAINVTPLSEKVELVDGSLEQNVTAGNAIDPIVFGYQSLYQVNLSGFPEGIGFEKDEATSTFSIIGAPDQDTPTHDFEYRVAAYTSEKDSIVFSGTISVEQQNFVTTLVTIENESQDVVAGYAIKPIVFRYAHMQTAVVDGILEGLEVSQDKEKDLVIISGSIPQNVGDRVLAIRVTAKGNNNDAEASATINISANPDYSSSSVSSSSAAESSSSYCAESSSSQEFSSSSNERSAIYAEQKAFRVNFANNELNVTFANKPGANVQIFDVMGHLIETIRIDASTTVHLGHLPRGKALLKVSGPGFAEIMQVVVK